MFLSFVSVIALFVPSVFAASAEQWRSRSIYQLFTDRYALPSGAKSSNCDPGDQTWCGGTWSAIRENLDYIQGAGFTAVWISPVNKNYDGPRTKYGDAYTGYWVTDISQLNEHFGTADDLKALSAELHKRGMYLMVDMVLNNVMATSIPTDYSSYFFKETSMYHPYCAIDWGNRTSEEDCWLGDTVVPLPDINTENPAVSQGYVDWIGGFIQEYSIDGLRLDAAKHAPAEFWTPICAKAGVFCMGEVFGNEIDLAASYQGPDALDSVLNYPIYDALVEAFAIPGPQNMTALVQVMQQSKQSYKDLSVLGNFLENQDNPRWSNISVDIQSMLNAMVFTFMTDGIPIVYYGQEQRFSGNADPWNREPLWPSHYANSTMYNSIATLNKIRSFVINQTDGGWTTSNAEILSSTDNGIAVLKGNVLSIMTNIGSPPQNTSIGVYTPWATLTSLMDVMSCTQHVVGSNGTVSVEYSLGGHAVVLLPTADLGESGLCGYKAPPVGGLDAHASTAGRLSVIPSSLVMISVLVMLGHLL
ncbi:glycoside hydrolase family 13 protein [Sphaerobolus stellatus SS14]|uniref:alpha-amylase n=1 Tax=Sphaerobolus stellatus (strain SS14) TaxID=990650 RepID=A0A0C9UXQ6_SPHS4|nr:glycoside hydrolase family 13 protein [Sphaerobolus stellatus SS14]